MQDLSHYPVIHQQSVAWGDMDAFGHVNNVQYYRYMESARIRYLDALNIFNQNVVTVVASSQCKYLSPVVYPDQLKVATRVEELRNSAFRMSYILWSEAQNNIVATGDAVVVCVDNKTMQKTAIPESIKEQIRKFELAVNNNI
ncbi:thioesterase [Acinetobacter sp. ANC 5054]|uniref:acyl-CoA thioesterase n=1 Tax=Acinetobacter sp. ANC 5054 TaxID=1977877 RepID=UPI000A32F05B|nr:thioesterase family protein [Acinetobacter sp. ANC 5054]OTG84411.1 thioesterase [Acinetobacter sp. ANC 5054]